MANRAFRAHLPAVLFNRVLMKVAAGGEKAVTDTAREFRSIMSILGVLVEGSNSRIFFITNLLIIFYILDNLFFIALKRIYKYYL